MNKINITALNDEIVEEIGLLLLQSLNNERIGYPLLRAFDNGSHVSGTTTHHLHFYNNHSICSPTDKTCEKACFYFVAEEEHSSKLLTCTFMIGKSDGSLKLISCKGIPATIIGNIDFMKGYIAIVDRLVTMKPANHPRYKSEKYLDECRYLTLAY